MTACTLARPDWVHFVDFERIFAFVGKGTCGQSEPEAPGALSTTYWNAGGAGLAWGALVPRGSHRALDSWWSHRTDVSLHARKARLSLFTLWASVSWDSLVTLGKKKIIIKNDLFSNCESCG